MRYFGRATGAAVLITYVEVENLCRMIPLIRMIAKIRPVVALLHRSPITASSILIAAEHSVISSSHDILQHWVKRIKIVRRLTGVQYYSSIDPDTPPTKQVPVGLRRPLIGTVAPPPIASVALIPPGYISFPPPHGSSVLFSNPLSLETIHFFFNTSYVS